MNRQTVLMRTLVILGIISVLFLAGCGSGTSQSLNNQPVPTNGSSAPPATNSLPTITSLSPSCAPHGEQVLNPFIGGQLLVNGQNFLASSVVRWNGNDRPTTFSSSSQLTAQISASDIAAAGTASVTVFNPATGGGNSNTSTFTITAGGVSPKSIAMDPMGKFAYMANEGCSDSVFGNVSMYTVDATTGALASIAPPVPSNDEGGWSVSVDPSGKFAYVVNWGEGDTAGSVAAYTINATTGALTFTGTTNGVCPGLCAPRSVVVDPSGKFVYVADEGGFAPTGVTMFSINTTTGALTSIGTNAAGGRAISVAVDPKGKFAYSATESEPPGSPGNVSMYTIDATTGALTFIGTIAAGTNPASVGVDPTGKFAYVTNSGSNDVSMYSINTTTGALTSITTIAAGATPVSVAVEPSGKFAYVANSGSNDVSMYSINATTGALASIGTIAAGSAPTSVAIHPSGKFAYVTNSGSNDVSMYSVDAATGALSLIGTAGT
jgi:YVTN family beta-propeller protein